jgi:hypothetical protein
MMISGYFIRLAGLATVGHVACECLFAQRYQVSNIRVGSLTAYHRAPDHSASKITCGVTSVDTVAL